MTSQTETKAVRESLREIIGWDIVNWSRALPFWSSYTDLQQRNAYCLELGCGTNSSLTLWLALLGNRMLCTDFGGVSDKIKDTHRRHSVDSMVSYADVDARAIPYRNEFDVVVFKSMLGGIVGDPESARRIVSGIHQALKPGGLLLIVENLKSTRVHQWGRQRCAAGSKGWWYFSRAELEYMLNPFESFEIETFGFLGCFGRSETQRTILGAADRLILDRVIPAGWHYVAAVAARKQ